MWNPLARLNAVVRPDPWSSRLGSPASRPLSRLLVPSLAIALTLAACGGAPQAKTSDDGSPIQIDGSSTVYPITQHLLTGFNDQTNNSVKAELKVSGTGGGFKKFCAGQTQINNASRPISTVEIAACKQNSINFIELPIAFDALTVVVHPSNTWANDITVAELKTLWQASAQGKMTRWSQVRPGWPDRPIRLYGAGRDSGTFDYFTEAITGKVGNSRSDYTASEDDNVLVEGIARDPNSLGYLGHSYYEKNKPRLKALAINNGNGPVAPSRAAVEKNQYRPLARPLIIYVNGTAAQERPALARFVEYYLKQAPEAVEQVGYIPLPAEGYHIDFVALQQFEVGTVFEGKSRFDLTIGELLRKKAKF